MTISVIIPTCNRNDLLSKCLDLLAPGVQATDGGLTYEVIVSDDSKESIAKKHIEQNYSWAAWKEGPKRGPAANRNNGAAHASGEWLVFIDDDCLPEANILLNYHHAFLRYTLQQAFEGTIIPDNPELMKIDLSECPINTEGDCFWSANIAIKKSLFNAVKGFDEDYLIAAQEDQQMKLDLEKATGRKIQFLKECVVVHPVRFTTVMKKIKKIKVESLYYCMYVLKNQQPKKEKTLTEFGLNEIRYRATVVYKSVKAMKLKSIIVYIAWFFYGVPLNILNYSKLKSSINK